MFDTELEFMANGIPIPVPESADDVLEGVWMSGQFLSDDRAIRAALAMIQLMRGDLHEGM